MERMGGVQTAAGVLGLYGSGIDLKALEACSPAQRESLGLAIFERSCDNAFWALPFG